MAAGAAPYLSGMRPTPILLAAVLLPTGAFAQPRAAHQAAHAAARPAAGAPKSIGKFEDWQSATHVEAGQNVCYAFVRAQPSQPPIAGRGDVVLTVTQRPGGRDAVAIATGYAFPPQSELVLTANGTDLPFYTNGRSAFARDGHAVTTAFSGARQAVAKAPGPRGAPVSDTFSLRGFSPAYAAINKACPAR